MKLIVDRHSTLFCDQALPNDVCETFAKDLTCISWPSFHSSYKRQWVYAVRVYCDYSDYAYPNYPAYNSNKVTRELCHYMMQLGWYVYGQTPDVMENIYAEKIDV